MVRGPNDNGLGSGVPGCRGGSQRQQKGSECKYKLSKSTFH